ncbi:MAG: ornithine cyclodeaminase family protein [Candidatus Aminicenantes bacterium]|nr:ornithine cyclodeaminase family protein [Candidatus Aminicenantes bacterium]
MNPSLLLLRRSEIASVLTLADCIPAVEEAFRMRADGKALAPGLMHIDADGGEFHIKGGGLRLDDRTYVGLKANGGFFRNKELFGLPAIQGVIILFDGTNGTPLAVMDSIEITILRTGAATAAAAKRLARADADTATICGCGNQGRVQLRALKLVRPNLVRAFAYDASAETARVFAADMSAELGLEVVPAPELESAARHSQIIVTCTPSRKPYLMRAFVRPGTFIAAVGADSPDKRELDPALLADASVFVDILDQSAHVGELHHALDAGLLTIDNVRGELGDLIAGRIPGRTSDEEITIFDSTGTALQDTAAAAAAYLEAVRRGLGQRIVLNS